MHCIDVQYNNLADIFTAGCLWDYYYYFEYSFGRLREHFKELYDLWKFIISPNLELLGDFGIREIGNMSAKCC